jgi:hypothetical protein
MLGDLRTPQLSRFAKPELRFDETSLRGIGGDHAVASRSPEDPAQRTSQACIAASDARRRTKICELNRLPMWQGVEGAAASRRFYDLWGSERSVARPPLFGEIWYRRRRLFRTLRHIRRAGERHAHLDRDSWFVRSPFRERQRSFPARPRFRTGNRRCCCVRTRRRDRRGSLGRTLRRSAYARMGARHARECVLDDQRNGRVVCASADRARAPGSRGARREVLARVRRSG